MGEVFHDGSDKGGSKKPKKWGQTLEIYTQEKASSKRVITCELSSRCRLGTKAKTALIPLLGGVDNESNGGKSKEGSDDETLG